MLKHVVVKKNDRFIGQYAVRVEEDRVKFKTVAGADLYYNLLEEVLNAADPDILKKAAELHQKRKYPWRVKKREGYSGCKDYWVEYLEEREFGIIRKGGRIHVSMSDKLNKGIDILLIDLHPILYYWKGLEGCDTEHPELTFENKDVEIGEFFEPTYSLFWDNITLDTYITQEIYIKLTGACEEGVRKFIDTHLSEYKEEGKIKLRELLPILEKHHPVRAGIIKRILKIKEEKNNKDYD